MFEPDKPLNWDEERASLLLGATVVVGITVTAANGTLVSQTQMHGVIAEADQTNGVRISLKGSRDGEDYWLPPDLSAFHPASPGTYRLRSTGEAIIDPDYTSSWTIKQPD